LSNGERRVFEKDPSVDFFQPTPAIRFKQAQN